MIPRPLRIKWQSTFDEAKKLAEGDVRGLPTIIKDLLYHNFYCYF